jgi:hypothetical protein
MWTVNRKLKAMSESKGAELITAERKRQIEELGHVSANDLGRAHQLVDAASCYMHAGLYKRGFVPPQWPWAARYWKPSKDTARNLTKAGALMAAAIDALRYEAEVFAAVSGVTNE